MINLCNTEFEQNNPTTKRGVLRHSAIFSLSEEYLERRFSRLEKSPEKIIYEITRDAAYRHQYYILRDGLPINMSGLERALGEEDAWDDTSEILIARIGNHCIGGCRLTFSDTSSHQTLPMENSNFQLKGMLPELALSHKCYVELSRVKLLPEFQDSQVASELLHQALKLALERKARYFFALSPIWALTPYRKAAGLFSLKWNIRYDIVVPDREEYEGIKMAVSILDLAPCYKPKSASLMDIDVGNMLMASAD